MPVNALSNEMTTGMSAPPIGSTNSTPKASAPRMIATSSASFSTPATIAIAEAEEHRQQDARLPYFWPGYVIGRPVISSWSFAKATMLPANDTEPMSAERTMATETLRSRSPGSRDRVVEVRERDQRRRPAADAVEQRHHLRHRGHLHGARRVRADRRRDGHDEDHPDELVGVEAGQEERRHDGDGHAEGADPVAVARLAPGSER